MTTLNLELFLVQPTSVSVCFITFVNIRIGSGCNICIKWAKWSTSSSFSRKQSETLLQNVQAGKALSYSATSIAISYVLYLGTLYNIKEREPMYVY